MPDVWDVLAPADLNDMDATTDRVLTEEFLHGRRPWPASGILPVKRVLGDGPVALEVGYLRKQMTSPEADPVVYAEGVGVASRRYVSIEQLLEAGWRVD